MMRFGGNYFFALLAIFFCHPLTAKMLNFGPANERLFKLTLENGFVLSDALLAYEENSEIYLPLEEFAGDLGFYVEAFPGQGQAKGTLREEREEFSIDLKDCSFRSPNLSENGKLLGGDCEFGRSFEDEIFISKALLEKWFEVEISIQTLRSRIIVNSLRTLPVERALEEKESRKYLLARNSAKGEREDRPASDAQKYPIGGPSVDLNIDTQNSFRKHQNGRFSLGVSGALGVEAENFENLFLYSFAEDGEFRGHYTLSRYSENEIKIGPIPLTQFRAFDVFLPEFSGVLSSRRGRGVFIANRPLNYSGVFTSTSLRGATEANWNVELYQSGVLIAATVADHLGLFVFDSVPLFYGNNIFQIVSIGPQGQRRESYRSFSVGDSRPSKGKFYYSTSMLRSDGGSEVVLTGDLGLSNRWSGGIRFVNLCTDASEECRWYLGQDLSSYWEFFRTKLDFVMGDQKQYYISPQLSFLFLTGAVDLGYVSLEQFESDIYPKFSTSFLDQASMVSFAKSTDALGTPIMLRLKNSVMQYSDLPDKLIETKVDLFSNRSGWQFQVGLERRDGLSSSWTWRQQVERSFGRSRARVRMTQTSSNSNAIYSEYSWKSSNGSWDSNLGLNYELYDSSFLGRFSLARDFDKFSSGFVLSSNFYSEMTLSLSLNTSFGADPRNRRVYQSGENMAQEAMLIVRVCRDKNFNLHCEIGEPGIENVELALNSRSEKYITDSDGMVQLLSLNPYSHYEISIDTKKVAELNLQAAKSKFYFYAEPLRALYLDIALAQTVELEGVIEFEDLNQGRPIAVKNREVILTRLSDGEKVIERSEFDGYFLFEGLRPEKYKLSIDLKPGEKLTSKLDILDLETGLNDGHSVEVKVERRASIN